MSGRVAVLLRWPLWSWRNLLVTAAAFLLLVAVVGRVSAASAGRSTAEEPTSGSTSRVASSPGPALSPATSTGPSSTTPESAARPAAGSGAPAAGASAPAVTGPTATGPTATGTPGPAAAQGSAATRAALAFVAAWARPSTPPEEWRTALGAMVTSGFRGSLTSVDPARVPATRVVGDARLVTSSATSASVEVPTDGGAVAVSLTRSGDGWLVSDIAPADQPPAAATPALTPSSAAGLPAG